MLNELADRLNGDGLPGRRLARATAAARSKAWRWIVARHGQLPAVKVAGLDLTRPGVDGVPASAAAGGDLGDTIVLDVDATLVTAHSEKEQAAANFKGGFGFHPVRREALLSRAEVRDHRRRPCRSRAVKLRTA